MAPRRRPTALDDELAALEREVAAATGSPVPAASADPPAKRARGDRLEQARTSSRSLFRKLAAVAIMIVAAAILLKVLIGVIASILWIVIAIAAVVALLWAWRQFK